MKEPLSIPRSGCLRTHSPAPSLRSSSLCLFVSFRSSRLSSACLLPVASAPTGRLFTGCTSPIGGAFPGCTVPGPSRLAPFAASFRFFGLISLRTFCSALPDFIPGCALTCLRAPCGLFSVQTIRVIPFRTASRVVPYLPPGSLWPLLGSDHPGYPQTAFRVVP